MARQLFCIYIEYEDLTKNWKQKEISCQTYFQNGKWKCNHSNSMSCHMIMFYYQHLSFLLSIQKSYLSYRYYSSDITIWWCHNIQMFLITISSHPNFVYWIPYLFSYFLSISAMKKVFWNNFRSVAYNNVRLVVMKLDTLRWFPCNLRRGFKIKYVYLTE